LSVDLIEKPAKLRKILMKSEKVRPYFPLFSVIE